jgi:hypothetical protein
MKARNTLGRRRTETGIALLISIFILLLISVVAIALIVSSGTESALAGNYRSSTGVYYAALSGLEEARGRLLVKNPDSFKNTTASFLPSPSGTPFAIGSPVYVINPAGGETVAPWDPSSTYPDTEFATEFSSSGFTAPPNPSPSALSVWNRSPLNSLNVPGPLYKWVRINAVSEKSLNLDVGPAYDGFKDPITPVFYDGAQLNVTSSGTQVLEITSLAVLPNGTQKIVQYLVAPQKNLVFGAAISLPGTHMFGNDVTFDYPNYGGGSSNFYVDGRDYPCSGFSPTANPPVWGLGYTDSTPPYYGSSNPSYVQPPGNYQGYGASPSLGNDSATLSQTFQTPANVEAFIQKYQLDPSTVNISTSATNSDLMSAAPSMSASNPVTILVDGDLTLTGSFIGYGMLIVTGNFQYTGGTSWNGIVLVIGQGWAKEVNTSDNGGRFRGAVVVAKSRHSTGTVISGSNLGPSYIDFNNPNGSSFYYSTCWIDAALPPAEYKILSFHEISQ